MEHKLKCRRCGKNMRHRAISGLYWCANTKCGHYSGVPPISVKITIQHQNLVHAMSDEVWDKVSMEVNKNG